MAKEWVGNYKLHYVEYLEYKNVFVSRTADLGKCLSHDDAAEKAAAFLWREKPICEMATLYLSDGWGNHIPVR